MFVIVVYDVEAKKDPLFAKICKPYLFHIQNSVFMGDITSADLRILTLKLKREVDLSKDTVDIFVMRSRKHIRNITIGDNRYKHENII